jgi:hypothetical protein
LKQAQLTAIAVLAVTIPAWLLWRRYVLAGGTDAPRTSSQPEAEAASG